MEDELGVRSLEDPSYTRELIASDSRVAKYDPKLLCIAKKLLHPDPIQRLTVDELLKKKYVRQWQSRLAKGRRGSCGTASSSLGEVCLSSEEVYSL